MSRLAHARGRRSRPSKDYLLLVFGDDNRRVHVCTHSCGAQLVLDNLANEHPSNLLFDKEQTKQIGILGIWEPRQLLPG